ncbi:hypothetical protein FGG08_005152 [Glutinoglossum americanum]|uniref:HNH nuclease domain-containing protein n=1 Tax=Glutinoglossum americanum TaxID=1670608 RepID=A0A9P8HV15_9PEZI|nr:hypothetical protein FGG08_005152 [Glutinoglossum americanum]
MDVTNRSSGRNVFIYDADNPAEPLGGFVLTAGMTNADLHLIMGMVCVLYSNYYIMDGLVYGTNKRIPSDGEELQPGKYYVLTNGYITVNEEPCLPQPVAADSETCPAPFRDAIRERDRRCAITGEGVTSSDRSGFEAAHIFPLSHEDHWNKNNFNRWITIPPAHGGPINSVQNGILLRSDIHELFRNYDMSINPRDNYKVICFRPDEKGIAGKHLDKQFVGDPRRPVDDLLWWHFRQAVLVNVRGDGEPISKSHTESGVSSS